MDNERSRKNHRAILQALSRVGQVTVANALNISETKVSRFKSEESESLAEMLACLGLKCVPIEMNCYRPEDIQALMVFAKERMNQLETPEQLVWED